MSPRDAWNMTMIEYNEIATVHKRKPTEIIYDKDAQDRIIGNHQTRAILNG